MQSTRASPAENCANSDLSVSCITETITVQEAAAAAVLSAVSVCFLFEMLTAEGEDSRGSRGPYGRSDRGRGGRGRGGRGRGGRGRGRGNGPLSQEKLDSAMDNYWGKEDSLNQAMDNYWNEGKPEFPYDTHIPSLSISLTDSEGQSGAAAGAETEATE